MRKTKKKVEKKGNICKICNKTIAGNAYKLKAHLYIKHKAVEPRHKCTICDKEYFRSDLFARHIDKHKGNPPKKTYTCDECDRSFINKRNLILHLQVHDDNLQLKYKCIACGAAYCEERLLKYHIRKTHYNLKDSVKTELKKETNETWIEQVKQSQICVEMTKVNDNVLSIKKFGSVKDEADDEKMTESVRKRNFKDYISSVFAQADKSHYSKAKCDYCHKEMLKKSLLSHIRERHLKLKRFKCEECHRMFNRHYQMVDHICGKERRKRCTPENVGSVLEIENA